LVALITGEPAVPAPIAVELRRPPGWRLCAAIYEEGPFGRLGGWISSYWGASDVPQGATVPRLRKEADGADRAVQGAAHRRLEEAIDARAYGGLLISLRADDGPSQIAAALEIGRLQHRARGRVALTGPWSLRSQLESVKDKWTWCRSLVELIDSIDVDGPYTPFQRTDYTSQSRKSRSQAAVYSLGLNTAGPQDMDSGMASVGIGPSTTQRRPLHSHTNNTPLQQRPLHPNSPPASCRKQRDDDAYIRSLLDSNQLSARVRRRFLIANFSTFDEAGEEGCIGRWDASRLAEALSSP
jgi:hypothetical protein